MTAKTMGSITIQIPATPDRAITPNGVAPMHRQTRGGHQKMRRLQRELKEATQWAVKSHYLDVFPDAPWRIDYVVAWGKGRRSMDKDNLIAGLKYLQDGIAAETGVDDRYIHVGDIKQIQDPLGVGYILVTISSVEEGIPT